MSERKCPNCDAVVEIKDTHKIIACPKCLHTTGKRFIMVETKSSPKIEDMGDGFFQEK